MASQPGISGKMQPSLSKPKTDSMNTYPVTQTTDLLAIAECKYAIGAKLKFTKFTSCLGLFCKVSGKDEVIGIHLVLVDGNDHKFTIADVPAIRQILTDNNAQLDTGWVVGCLDNWPGDIKNSFYQLFEDAEGERIMNSGAGWYSATVAGNNVVVNFEA